MIVMLMSFFMYLLFCSTNAYAISNDSQLLTGPTIKIQAIIKPYINITINSPVNIQSNLSSTSPAVIFDCNKGPGTYQASQPLTFAIVSNTPFQLQFEATPLVEKDSKAIISAERLAIRFNDPAKISNNYSSFKKGEKKTIFETTNGGVSFATECDFQLDITYDDKAGTYEGSIFVEVLYQP